VTGEIDANAHGGDEQAADREDESPSGGGQDGNCEKIGHDATDKGES